MAALSGVKWAAYFKLLALLRCGWCLFMSDKKLKHIFTLILQDLGLNKAARFYYDAKFLFALFSSVVVLFFIYPYMPVFSSELKLSWTLLISLIIWQPLIEELLFRGVIQGQASKYKWGQAKIFHVTSANIITSFLFVAIHLFNSLLLWSLAIFIPSLLYGYFKDLFNSVYPAIVLHGAYNALVIIALYVNGNAAF